MKNKYWIFGANSMRLIRKSNTAVCASGEVVVDISEWSKEALAKFNVIRPPNKTFRPNVTEPILKTEQQVRDYIHGVHDFTHLTQEQRDKLKSAKGRELVDMLREVGGVSTCCEDKALEIIKRSIDGGRL